MSPTGTPSAPCRRMNAFCASENFEAFIVFRSSQPGKVPRKTLTLNGPVFGEQIRALVVEVALARRYYDAINPDNRLVVSELRQRWNPRLKRSVGSEKRSPRSA